MTKPTATYYYLCEDCLDVIKHDRLDMRNCELWQCHKCHSHSVTAYTGEALLLHAVRLERDGRKISPASLEGVSK